MKSNDDSLSMAPYNNFNSLTAEDSVEQIRKRSTDTRNVTENVKPVSNNRTLSQEYCYKLIDVVAVVVIITVLWLLMAIPTVAYAYHVATLEVQKLQKATALNMANDNGHNTTCESALYDRNNSICKQHLQAYTNCLKGSRSEKANPDVYVSSPFQQNLMHAESIIGLLPFAYTKVNVRPQCRLSLEPLICLYYIHLCDNGTDIGPNQEQCGYVSNVCDNELEQTKKLNLPIPVEEVLSSCASGGPFDEKNCIITGRYNNMVNNCSAGFYQNSTGKGRSQCQPECSVWSPYSKTTVLTTDVLNIFAAVICVISGGAVLVLSWIRRQKLYHYPSIFIIYQTVLAMVLSMLVLVGVSARRSLFCRSRSLLESVTNPTVFCFMTGIALYYIVMQLLLWWLWHTLAVFWGVVWPFHARKFNRSRNVKYLHLIFIFVSLVLPVVPVVIVIVASSKRGGFTITRAPPILCAGYDLHPNFWAFIFPLNLLLAVGVTLLVFILRIIIKNHYISRIHKITANLNWAMETKVLIVLCYYIVLGAAVLSIFTIALFNIDISKLIDYFSCEARGLPPNTNVSECEKQLKTIQSTNNPIPISLAIVILGFLPVVNLVYIVKFRELKRKIKTYSQVRYVHHIQEEASKSAASRYIPYNEHKETTLQCHSVTLHDNTLHSEPLLTSQMNNDFRR